MKLLFSKNSAFRSRPVQSVLLAVISGALFIVSWPGVGEWWPIVFFAFVPLFRILQWRVLGEISGSQFLWSMMGAFFLWNVGTLYFLFNLNEHMGIRLLSLLTPVLINTIWMTALMLVFQWCAKRAGMIPGLVVFILCWPSVEWGQHHWALAFPWLTLGNVMAPHPEWIQWYSVTGVAGGSLWVLLANAIIYLAAYPPKQTGKAWGWAASVVMLLAPMVWSFLLNEAPEENDNTKRYTIVQPRLDNLEEKFEAGKLEEHIQRSFNSVHELTENPGIVVLPETFLYEPGGLSGPRNSLNFAGLWMHHPEGSVAIKLLREELKDSNVSGIISGAFATKFYAGGMKVPVHAHPISGLDAYAVHYNSAVAVNKDDLEWRHKRMLVVGVEQIPFAETFPFLNKLALDFGGIAGSLGRSTEVTPLEMDDHKPSVQICYDSVFGWLSVDLARDGAEVLVIITNDSWWGDTPGYRQLFSFARLRAIETGKPVVRSANSGISAFISPRGEIIDQLDWEQRGSITAEISPQRDTTFYVRHGDYIYRWSALTLPLLLILGWIWKQRSR